jgi:hypothetical protein
LAGAAIAVAGGASAAAAEAEDAAGVVSGLELEQAARGTSTTIPAAAVMRAFRFMTVPFSV